MPIDLNLERALKALVDEGTKYPGTRGTYIADFALYAFVTDVREHASAVNILASSPVPRAAFANARAALESAVDSAFLVNDEADYLYRGAQARVSELFEIDGIEKRTVPLDSVPINASQRASPEDAIIADAKAWDVDAPGKGDLLRRAWESFTKFPGAHRMHWSLLSKEQVYERVFHDEEAKQLGGMASVIHALLSSATHPRMRVGSRDIEFTEEGGVVLGTRKSDSDMARKVAAFSCILATSSLQRRRTFAALPSRK